VVGSGTANSINATDTNSSSTFYPVFVPTTGSDQIAYADDPNLRYIPSSGTLYANSIVTSGSGSSGNITGANVISGITLSASGTVYAGTVSVSGTVTASGIINGAGNGVGNIGSSTTYFNTVFAKATSAQYADLAEHYETDNTYNPGTVVVFGGEKEITTTTVRADARVAGAISTQPAYLMNSEAVGLPVALRGRVPVKLIGPVTKGDSLITSTQAGFAESIGTDQTYGQTVFAKALETNLEPGQKTIIAVIL
jgi:hypothetical protein